MATHKLMRLRIALQGSAILLFIVFMLAYQKLGRAMASSLASTRAAAIRGVRLWAMAPGLSSTTPASRPTGRWMSDAADDDVHLFCCLVQLRTCNLKHFKLGIFDHVFVDVENRAKCGTIP